MDPIAKVLPIVQQDLPGKATNVSVDKPPAVAKPKPIRPVALRRLWARMASIYGYRWSNSYGESPEDDKGALTVAGDTWQRGLQGITERQVGIGISACIASSDPWPPSLPEFRALCLEVPSFALAVRWQTRHTTAERPPFAVLMWQFIDGWRFGQAGSVEAEKMLRYAYEQARDHVMRGGELPPPSKGLPRPVVSTPKPGNPQVAAAAMRDIAAKLATTSTEEAICEEAG